MTKDNKRSKPTWEYPPTFGKKGRIRNPYEVCEYDFVFRGEHPKQKKK